MRLRTILNCLHVDWIWSYSLHYVFYYHVSICSCFFGNKKKKAFIFNVCLQFEIWLLVTIYSRQKWLGWVGQGKKLLMNNYNVKCKWDWTILTNIRSDYPSSFSQSNQKLSHVWNPKCHWIDWDQCFHYFLIDFRIYKI